ncbi:helix-turn-helix domain-containing protein [Facklamia miroungae]|uniref:Transcriptional regulator, contains XRE-family HTH domain n=1 Tax=Facklamia miroungae TaxID=120956 RepID=A0A1G7NXJ4_9LACT|nr:helix-turn-helix transcriptional regulator [Facklamia miroungae]NKZ28508.1 helix-turn-helix transcriptional regulator [Facklamia miroungae]SDF78798.1 Transcriptional regulator, contains XRE-family HTH domain [Facklamia miroungae]
MGLVDRIKTLCDSKLITFAELERKIGISNGQLRRWDDVSPKTENVQKVADYFNVSIDYLLGRTDNPNIQDDDNFLLAAHIDGDFTEEEMEDIKDYIEFIKSKHRK